MRKSGECDGLSKYMFGSEGTMTSTVLDHKFYYTGEKMRSRLEIEAATATNSAVTIDPYGGIWSVPKQGISGSCNFNYGAKFMEERDDTCRSTQFCSLCETNFNPFKYTNDLTVYGGRDASSTVHPIKV